MAETQESLRADMENLYGSLKALSEAEVRKHFGERTTIVRPGYIVGPRDETDRFTYWPLRVAQGGEMLVPGDGQDPIQIIDGRDLGEWMIRLAEARAYGVFNAVGPDYTLTTDAMLSAARPSPRMACNSPMSPRSSSKTRRSNCRSGSHARITPMPATARSAMRAHWPRE